MQSNSPPRGVFYCLTMLLKRHFAEASELAAMYASIAERAYSFHRHESDAQVLINAFAVKFVSHSRQLQLPMQRFVGNAEQGAVRHAEAKAIGSDGGGFHVERNSAALAQALDWHALL